MSNPLYIHSCLCCNSSQTGHLVSSSPSKTPEPNKLYATTLTWSLTALFQSPDLMIQLNSETVVQARANRGMSVWSRRGRCQWILQPQNTTLKIVIKSGWLMTGRNLIRKYQLIERDLCFMTNTAWVNYNIT